MQHYCCPLVTNRGKYLQSKNNKFLQFFLTNKMFAQLLQCLLMSSPVKQNGIWRPRQSTFCFWLLLHSKPIHPAAWGIGWAHAFLEWKIIVLLWALYSQSIRLGLGLLLCGEKHYCCRQNISASKTASLGVHLQEIYMWSTSADLN